MIVYPNEVVSYDVTVYDNTGTPISATVTDATLTVNSDAPIAATVVGQTISATIPADVVNGSIAWTWTEDAGGNVSTQSLTIPITVGVLHLLVAPLIAVVSGNGEWTVDDTLPAFTATLKDANGVADLSGATEVRLHFKSKFGTSEPVSLVISVSDAAGGVVTYDWQETDLQRDPGLYAWEVRVTAPNGIATFHGSTPINLLDVLAVP